MKAIHLFILISIIASNLNISYAQTIITKQSIENRFISALKNYDIEAMIGISGLPYNWDAKETITSIDTLRSKWEEVFIKSFDSLNLIHSEEFDAEQLKNKIGCVSRLDHDQHSKIKYKLLTITSEGFSDYEYIILDIIEDEKGDVKVFGFRD